jgi:hypothetical protein
MALLRRCISSIKRTFESLGLEPNELVRESLAEFLLREGIVSALWNTTSRTCAAQSDRWKKSITQVANEIHAEAPVAKWVIELLSGMSDPSHFHSYLSEDEQVLEAVTVPPV